MNGSLNGSYLNVDSSYLVNTILKLNGEPSVKMNGKPPIENWSDQFLSDNKVNAESGLPSRFVVVVSFKQNMKKR